ncbi:hypothetical protein FA15DRAFT_220189 [Coprinopsis marcescibilis]|uniref:Histone chaperone RTT106/FACT complex subunit SPT16-like middle domain-containing protein n=1 Tax=Coprinopsis marcescibilis TaxID=230819 RepID=A0A5C3L3G1_COPMA|nr:hypothetical protein FA15DRAFT_220189 [Coprinopsis marcescibilis]
MDAQYLQTLLPSLPDELAVTWASLSATSGTPAFLEEILRFVVGAPPTSNASESLKQQWKEKQSVARASLLSLAPPSQSQSDNRKRTSEDAELGNETKRQRTSPLSNGTTVTNDPSVFTIHAVSATSPVRKKVDIVIGNTTIVLKNPTSHATEASIPLLSIRRAFILPTRGKSKPHWTVVLLSTDSTVPGKPNNANAQDGQQIIFGLDATAATPLATTLHTNGAEPVKSSIPKGSPTLPSIRAVLSHLSSTKLYEPTTEVFKSMCPGIGSNASATGIPGIEAYRAAKQGSLWFMKEGILWGESKPCEFWSVEDLFNAEEGVRLSPGSGRVFSITLTRKVESETSKGKQKDDEEDEQEQEGIETEFGMVDSRERDVVAEWVRKHQKRFGRKDGEAPPPEDLQKPKQKAPQYAGLTTIAQMALESDSEDEDFEDSSSGDEESGSGSDSDEEDGEGGSNDGEDDAEGTDDGEGEDGEEGSGDDEEEELDPRRHPLMRPGAVPKMGKGVMDMVVGIVEDQLMGGPEVDELEDD